jgi:hypothetical protein
MSLYEDVDDLHMNNNVSTKMTTLELLLKPTNSRSVDITPYASFSDSNLSPDIASLPESSFLKPQTYGFAMSDTGEDSDQETSNLRKRKCHISSTSTDDTNTIAGDLASVNPKRVIKRVKFILQNNDNTGEMDQHNGQSAAVAPDPLVQGPPNNLGPVHNVTTLPLPPPRILMGLPLTSPERLLYSTPMPLIGGTW